MNRFATLLKSKTAWGSVFAAGAWLAGQPKIGVLEVLQAAGTVLSVIGARDAITKTQQP